MSRSNYDKPFYVDVGTSIAAIRCASNHDVISETDHHGSNEWVKLVEEECDRMNREVELFTQNRNCEAAAMREALDAVVEVGYPHNFQREAPHISGYCYDITKAIKKCFAALSATPRNCDRYSHDEALTIWAAEKENGYNGCFDEWLYSTAKT